MNPDDSQSFSSAVFTVEDLLEGYAVDFYSGMESDKDFTNMIQFAKTKDLSDLVDLLRPNKTELDLWGHTLEDLVLQCSFDRQDCNLS